MLYKSACASILVCLYVLALPLTTYGASPRQKSIRIQLLKISSGGSPVFSASKGLLDIQFEERHESVRSVRAEPDQSAVRIWILDRQEMLSSSRFVLRTQDTDGAMVVETGSRTYSYAGSLEVSCRDGRLTVINELDIEQYVSGVLPAEMPELYPIEALKAQAIVIRTYAVRNLGKHAAAGADLCDSTHCQSYEGIVKAKPRCAQASAETEGLILTFAGGPAHVQYCADGGGATQDYASLYNRPDLPYLCGVIDPAGVPHASWEATYTLRDIEQRLLRAGIGKARGLTSISISQKAESGRVISVEVTGETGCEQVKAVKLRDLLGHDSLKSTLFAIESNGEGSVTFHGRGYGHGIGLSQAGCKELAKPPFNYTWDRLLAHYFPGTQVARIGEAPASSEARSSEQMAALQAEQRARAQPKTQPHDDKQARPMMELRLIDPGRP